MNRIRWLLLFLTLLGSTARPVANEGVIDVAYGTSYGMCIGYCVKQIRITGGKVDFSAEGWYFTKGPDVQATNSNTGQSFAVGSSKQVPMKPVHTTLLLSSSEQQELRRLMRDARVDDLPDRIGCPDCRDQGAEWIEVVDKSFKNRRITFEKGAPPSQLKELVSWLSGLQARFSTPPLPLHQ